MCNCCCDIVKQKKGRGDSTGKGEIVGWKKGDRKRQRNNGIGESGILMESI